MEASAGETSDVLRDGEESAEVFATGGEIDPSEAPDEPSSPVIPTVTDAIEPSRGESGTGSRSPASPARGETGSTPAARLAAHQVYQAAHQNDSEVALAVMPTTPLNQTHGATEDTNHVDLERTEARGDVGGMASDESPRAAAQENVFSDSAGGVGHSDVVQENSFPDSSSAHAMESESPVVHASIGEAADQGAGGARSRFDGQGCSGGTEHTASSPSRRQVDGVEDGGEVDAHVDGDGEIVQQDQTYSCDEASEEGEQQRGQEQEDRVRFNPPARFQRDHGDGKDSEGGICEDGSFEIVDERDGDGASSEYGVEKEGDEASGEALEHQKDDEPDVGEEQQEDIENQPTGDWCPHVNSGVGPLFSDLRTALGADFPAAASSSNVNSDGARALTKWFATLSEGTRQAVTAGTDARSFDADFADFGQLEPALALEKVGERLPDFSILANREFNPSLVT